MLTRYQVLCTLHASFHLSLQWPCEEALLLSPFCRWNWGLEGSNNRLNSIPGLPDTKAHELNLGNTLSLAGKWFILRWFSGLVYQAYHLLAIGFFLVCICFQMQILLFFLWAVRPTLHNLDCSGSRNLLWGLLIGNEKRAWSLKGDKWLWVA